MTERAARARSASAIAADAERRDDDGGSLAALQRRTLFETPPGETFDRFTRLAARALNAPVALVSLVDDHSQLLKGAVGLPEPWASRREAPLAHPLCQHVVQGGAPLVVENAREHPLVSANAAIADLGVVACVGVPITTAGYTLGSLCVMDRRPRVWTTEEVQVVQDLAACVAREIELRALALAEGGAQQRYQELVDSLDAVVWEADATTFQFTFINKHIEAVLGYPVERWLTEPHFWAEHIHPDDRAWATNYCLTCTAARQDHAFEYRMLAADGRVVWIHDMVRVILDETGQARYLRGVMTDVSEAKRNEVLIAGHARALEQIAAGAPLAETLTGLTRFVEEQSTDGLLASILLLDDDGIHLRHGAAPSLPEDYCRAIDGLTIGPRVGSCGTAAYRGEPVVVADIATDPLWADFRALALPLGLRACWSAPIRGSDGRVLGTFALYYRAPREPSSEDWQLLDLVTRAAAIAIERARAETALRESEERLHLAVESARLGTWDYHPRTGTLIWSPRCRELFGLPPDAPVSYEVFVAGLHPDDRAAIHAAVQRALDPASGGEFDVEYRTVGIQDGVVRWLAAKGRAFFNAAGEAERFTGTALDVSAQKRAEAAQAELIERERQRVAQLQGLTEASLAISSSLSLDAVLQAITDQARQIIGAHLAVTSFTADRNWAQAITALSLSDKYAAYRGFDAPPDGSGIYALVCEQNRPLRLTQAELERHPRWRGFGRYAAQHPPLRGWLAAPLTDPAGRNAGLIQLSDKEAGEFTAEDEALLVQLARLASLAIENARLYDAVEQEVRVRNAFFAAASHDLKNPLAAIKGRAQMLLRQRARHGAIEPSALDAGLTSIDATATRMTALIDMLLDVARLQLGQPLPLHRQPVDLVALVQQVVVEQQATTDRHDLAVATTLASLVGTWDGPRLERVIANLLSNAIKYTPDGGRIGIALTEERTGDGAWAALVVRDPGVGIPAADLPHIFDHFRRGANVTGQFAGTGVGLAAARQIVEQHGGAIYVESQEGAGTAVTVRLPLDASLPDNGNGGS